MTEILSGWSPEQARRRMDELFTRISDGFPAVSNGHDDPMIDGLSALGEVEDEVAALLALLDDARETLEMRRWSDKCPDCYCDVWIGRHSDACEATRAFLARFAADKDST